MAQMKGKRDMGFFNSMSSMAGKARDWGAATARGAYNAAADKAGQASDWAAAGLEMGKDAAREKIHGIAREKARQAVKNRDMLDSIDRRAHFNANVIQRCPRRGGAPVEGDGYFLGQDCTKPSGTRPDKGKGHKPHGCENCGAEFEQVTFTNGIDNSLEEVCATIQQLSDELCVEVVGIYNASYKDAKLPPRSAAENMALLTGGANGAVGGAIDGMKYGRPETAPIRAAIGGAKEGGKELLKQEVPRRIPQSQDVLDVIDTLAARSQQPATVTMAKDIVDSLRKGQSVNLIGHSEGGVNTVAAIAQAKRKMVDQRKTVLRTKNPSLEGRAASIRANQEVELLFSKRMNVTLLGTQQTGFPDGPNYKRVAHKSDLVPDGISGAQDAIGRAGYDKEPSSGGIAASPVERFPIVNAQGLKLGTDTLNPATAHSMKDSYIPYMREKIGRTKGTSCC